MAEIKRPLATIGFSILLFSFMTLTMPRKDIVFLLALFLLYIIVYFFVKKTHTAVLLIIWVTGVAAFLYTSSFVNNYYIEINKISKEDMTYKGYVTNINNKYNPSPYTINITDKQSGFTEKFSVKVFTMEDLQVGDVIEFNGKFLPLPPSNKNLNGYFNNIKGNISATNIEILQKQENGIKYKALIFKEKILEKADSIYKGDARDIVFSMGYSDKSFLSDNVKKSFAAAGISHALVVSGFHVGVILGLIFFLMKMININIKIKNIIVCSFLAVFMTIIGFAPSVTRAGVVVILSLLARNLNKSTDNLTVLGIIVGVTTVSNPFAAANIGLLLSYTACLGIIYSNHISNKYSLSPLQSNLLAATFAVLATTPILSLAGMTVTLLSPIYNVLFFPIIAIICLLSFLTPLMSFLGIFGIAINFFLVPVNKTLIKILLFCTGFIEKHFQGWIISLSGEIVVILIIAIIISCCIGYLHMKNKKHIKFIALFISIVIILCYNLSHQNIAVINVFDMGSEPGFLIKYKEKSSLIISKEISPRKLKNIMIGRNDETLDNIFICTKNSVKHNELKDSAYQVIDMTIPKRYDYNNFFISSYITDEFAKYIIRINDFSIGFGHGNISVEKDDITLYFLGNDNPKYIIAEDIFAYSEKKWWIDNTDISKIYDDLTIKVNVKTGKYKIVRDVYNFGYGI